MFKRSALLTISIVNGITFHNTNQWKYDLITWSEVQGLFHIPLVCIYIKLRIIYYYCTQAEEYLRAYLVEEAIRRERAKKVQSSHQKIYISRRWNTIQMYLQNKMYIFFCIGKVVNNIISRYCDKTINSKNCQTHQTILSHFWSKLSC